jgi:hypothetical protein
MYFKQVVFFPCLLMKPCVDGKSRSSNLFHASERNWTTSRVRPFIFFTTVLKMEHKLGSDHVSNPWSNGHQSKGESSIMFS